MHVYNESDPETVLPNRKEAEEICTSSSGQLASLTTEQELKTVYSFLTTFCPTTGDVTIGLQRQSGLERNVRQNWIWSSGEQYTGDINWGNSDPNIDNSKNACVRLVVKKGKPPMFLDNIFNRKIQAFMCEKHVDELYSPSGTPYFRKMQLSHGCRRHDYVERSGQC
ncbi:layilin-like [Antedon mediterranea]|uniref:layilin-like n=1 Tax=Antedon mediterranea TaxID=105859 RepID=UPI003AF78511